MVAAEDVALFNVPDVLHRFAGDERPGLQALPEMKKYRQWFDSHVDEPFAAPTQTTSSSYGYWIDVLGWTALGESWDTINRSRNHHRFGTIVQWFFEALVGSKPLRAGFEKIEYVVYRVGSGSYEFRIAPPSEWPRLTASR